MKKIIFFTIWATLLLLVPITILKVTPITPATWHLSALTYLGQRIFGLAAFTLLFIELILGAFMEKLTKRLGNWIFDVHVFDGILIYFLAFFHPLLFMVFNHFLGLGWDPYAVFINACLLCPKPIYYYYTLGIISFWLLTITVFAGLFRASNPWLRKNWRKLHVINYVVFLIAGLHGFLIGSDFRVQPFFTFAIVAYVIALGIIIFIELPRLYRNYIKWLRG